MKLMIGAVSVSTPAYREIHEKALTVFDELVLNPFGRPLTEEEVLARWQGADAVIAGLERYTAEMIEKAPPELKVISKNGVGVDNIDLEACRKRGITVCNTPGANAVEVAEATIGLMLAVLRNIALSDRQLRSGVWKRIPGRLLQGALIGVVGMGNIGKNVIRRLQAFGSKCIAYDPFFDEAFAEEQGVRRASLEEILREADIVTLHVPALPETYHLINRDTLRLMKPEAVLINAARGDLVEEEALYEALRDGVIAGAGLDVFSQEPMTESPLYTLDNVVVTPHMAGTTLQTTKKMGFIALDNAVKVLRGEDGAAIVR